MRKTGFWITLVVFLVLSSFAAIFLVPWKDRAGTAVVRQDGKVLYTIDLNAVKEPYTFKVEGKNGACNEVSVEQSRIRVCEANCPDQVCVRQGWISSSGTPIVCLPHGIVIEITGEGNGADAIIK